MKHTIYEDPTTHKFAILRLPDGFRTGDRLPKPTPSRWFDSREAAVAVLSELLDLDE